MAISDRFSLALLVVFVFAASSVSALRCYTCNSNDNSECLAPPTTFTEEEYRDNRSVPARLLVECPLDEQGREPFCRKFDLYVDGGNLPDHTRILRECGYERGHRPCYLFENGGHTEHVCQCFTDGCNGGSQLTVAGVLLAFIYTILLLGFRQRTL